MCGVARTIPNRISEVWCLYNTCIDVDGADAELVLEFSLPYVCSQSMVCITGDNTAVLAFPPGFRIAETTTDACVGCIMYTSDDSVVPVYLTAEQLRVNVVDCSHIPPLLHAFPGTLCIVLLSPLKSLTLRVRVSHTRKRCLCECYDLALPEFASYGSVPYNRRARGQQRGHFPRCCVHM